MRSGMLPSISALFGRLRRRAVDAPSSHYSRFSAPLPRRSDKEANKEKMRKYERDRLRCGSFSLRAGDTEAQPQTGAHRVVFVLPWCPVCPPRVKADLCISLSQVLLRCVRARQHCLRPGHLPGLRRHGAQPP